MALRLRLASQALSNLKTLLFLLVQESLERSLNTLDAAKGVL